MTNPSAAPPLPMTDLGRLLCGKNADANLAQLCSILADEDLRVRARMAAGLGQEDYPRAERRLQALRHAEAVLKSIKIFTAT
jgi:hypothetical protein